MSHIRRYSAATVLVLIGSTLVLSGCAGAGPAPATEQPEQKVSQSTDGAGSSAASVDNEYALPGLNPGEIPVVPAFEVPDISLMLASKDKFNIDVARQIESVPGVKVEPATCDGTKLSFDNGTSDGDGSATFWKNGKFVTRNSDGSGSYSKGSVFIENNGDGSGSYSDSSVNISNDGDGGGSYSKGNVSITLTGDGGGTYTKGTATTQINSDGSGNYSNGSTQIMNNGDGSGSYSDATWYIEVARDGTAQVFKDGGEMKEFKGKSLKPLAAVGEFPPMDSMSPVKACGTKITLADSILFEVDDSTISTSAENTLKSVAQVFKKAGVPEATVYGHTDSVNSDSENLILSQERADAVVDFLNSQGAAAALTATGMGEKHPVAQNATTDGKDNPAGRQKNRRVEIFVPTF